MRLDFCLLIVDDNPESVDEAIGDLRDHLESKGFTLSQTVAPVLTEKALKDLARSEGKNYNLVMVDFNLGSDDVNGATAALKLRHEMKYTDMVFYSSSPTVDLFAELAKHAVEGVFVAGRRDLGDALKGLADTVIGKAVDLSHMRGIAMAEVSEMDVMMEDVLERFFSHTDDSIAKISDRTLTKLLESIDEHRADLARLVEHGKIIDVVTDPRLFPSMQKYKALMRAIQTVERRPAEQVETLKDYDKDVIGNRNTLAHAKEETLDDGTLALRAILPGRPPIPIDDIWMQDFRGKLRTQRSALNVVCSALDDHLSRLNSAQQAK